MSNPRGNPKSILEACQHARDEINEVCALPRIVDSDVYILEKFVKDFLAQKFNIAYMKANKDVPQTLEDLWKSIVS